MTNPTVCLMCGDDPCKCRIERMKPRVFNIYVLDDDGIEWEDVNTLIIHTGGDLIPRIDVRISSDMLQTITRRWRKEFNRL